MSVEEEEQPRFLVARHAVATAIGLGWFIFAAYVLLDSYQQQRKSNKEEQHSQQPRPPMVASEPDQPQTQEQTDSTKQKAPHWYSTLVTEPNWVLAIVGILTLATIAWQAWETRRAAQAARDSIEASHRQFQLVNQQWLDTRNWGVRVRNNDEGRPMLEISYQVYNPTKMSLDVLSVHTTAFVMQPPVIANGETPQTRYFGAGGIKSGVPVGMALPPDRDVPLEAARYFLDDPDKQRVWNQRFLQIHISGTVEYRDVFDQRRTQAFGRMLLVGQNQPAVFQRADYGIEHHPDRNVFGDPTRER